MYKRQLLRNAFKRAGLPLYLYPYGVLPTGYERGIIEVVPHTASRASLGETSDGGLFEVFQARYGAPGTEAFEAAREAFLVSQAGYAIASFLVQARRCPALPVACCPPRLPRHLCCRSATWAQAHAHRLLPAAQRRCKQSPASYVSSI